MGDALTGIADETLLKLYASTFGITVSQAKHNLGVWRLDPEWVERAKAAIRAKGPSQADQSMARYRAEKG